MQILNILLSERVSLINTEYKHLPEAPIEKCWETLKSLHCDIPWGPNDSKVIVNRIPILSCQEK